MTENCHWKKNIFRFIMISKMDKKIKYIPLITASSIFSPPLKARWGRRATPQPMYHGLGGNSWSKTREIRRRWTARSIAINPYVEALFVFHISILKCSKSKSKSTNRWIHSLIKQKKSISLVFSKNILQYFKFEKW